MTAAADDRGRPGSAFSDTVVLTWRNLKRIPRIPELAAFAILQSVMFVLLFAFVFGGAIPLPGGGSYREYLMPGIFAQTLAFASATTTRRGHRRHAEGAGGPVPVAADGALGLPDRADDRRRGLQRRHPGRAHGDRAGGRLADPRRRAAVPRARSASRCSSRTR